MTYGPGLWPWVIGACVAAYLIKLSGYLIPRRWLDHPAFLRIAAGMTVGLLASLTVVNAVATGQQVVADARLVALGAAAVALLLRAPFLVVVIVGAVAAALARLAGLP